MNANRLCSKVIVECAEKRLQRRLEEAERRRAVEKWRQDGNGDLRRHQDAPRPSSSMEDVLDGTNGRRSSIESQLVP
jgi:hypothetical protein